MIYEFIATISAGFALAGIALIIRHLSKLILKKQPPKWIIPLFAFIGIMGFQIHQEYNWFTQMQSRLKVEVEVVKKIEKTTWYRPWSYIKPQTVRVMAVGVEDIGDIKDKEQLNPSFKTRNLYLFERRKFQPIIVPQVFDCENGKLARIDGNKKLVWNDIEKTDKLYMTVCQ